MFIYVVIIDMALLEAVFLHVDLHDCEDIDEKEHFFFFFSFSFSSSSYACRRIEDILVRGDGSVDC